MQFLKRMIEIKWPFLLIELVFLFVGVTLIITGIKIWKKSKSAAIVNIVIGFTMTLVMLWVLFWTLIFGYNS